MPVGNHLMTYEDICRCVGRLFLESQAEIDRLSVGHDNPVVEMLRSQLQTAERKVAELERKLALHEGGAIV